MRELLMNEIDVVGGGVTGDTAFTTAACVTVGLVAVAATAAAPVVVAAAAIGAVVGGIETAWYAIMED